MSGSNKALFVRWRGEWVQLTEAVSGGECREWLEHYKQWFPAERFEVGHAKDEAE